MNNTLSQKEAKLIDFLQKLPTPALAFSGGVDSALLLAACQKAKVDIKVFIYGVMRTWELVVLNQCFVPLMIMKLWIWKI
jgi:PP-loop superfamily ATP-utilizing enzyme